MNIKEYLKKSSIYNVLSTESIISEDFREKLSKISKIIIAVLIFILLFLYFTKNNPRYFELKNFVDTYHIVNKIEGFVFFTIGVYLYSILLGFYYSSTYYFEKRVKHKYTKDELYTFSAGRILYSGRYTDILHGFFDSDVGKKILFRLGIDQKTAKNFYYSQRLIINEQVPEPEGNVLKTKDIAKFLYAKKDFAKFLNDRKITDKEFFGAVEWVIYETETKEYNSQWWRPETLANKKNIAGDWSFGQTFLLDRYSRNLKNDKEVNSDILSFENRNSEISQIENALLKTSRANVMLIGEPGQERMQVVWNLCKKINNKTIAPALQDKKPVLLIANYIISECKDKITLENQLTKVFNEAINAGNIILVIANFTELFKYAQSFGVDFLGFLDHCCTETSVQIIALVNSTDFHQNFESDKTLANNFEIIQVKPLSQEEIVRIIYASALDSEKINKITFTFPAVLELANSANYYFFNGVSFDIALNLLNEIAPWARKNGYKIVGQDEVLEFIEQKTNIPTSGKISEEEKEKLIKLDELIGKRVIGQNDAISAISNAMRRARTGVRNTNKPLGSFLFYGPTGVGKTETAKALAYVFFGSENNMVRFDMSEYQSSDAMDKLIGSFATGKPGVFSNLIKENPYGVVLLDEFEKASKDVLNVFLQIFDEGVFSDMTGQKISAKNIIFIATSNAGADRIFEMINEGKDIKSEQEEIIEDIIRNGLFRPELINRFDATIIFKPLERNDLEEIAKIMLGKLSDRIKDKGLSIDISNELIGYVVKHGTSKAFGARPMNRFIQDFVEGKIADLILEGSAIPGKIVKFDVIDDKLSASV